MWFVDDALASLGNLICKQFTSEMECFDKTRVKAKRVNPE